MNEGYPRRGIERLTDLPVSWMVRGAGRILRSLGPAAAYGFARFVGDSWYRFVPRRRLIALRNLEIAFRGELDEVERVRIARECCRHAMANSVDMFIRDRWITKETWRDFVSIDAETEALIGRPHPRGLAVLVAHVGAWEMLHYVLALRGLRAATVVRLVHNPHLDRLMTSLRTRWNVSVILKAGGLLKMRRMLRSGGAVGLLCDQVAPAGSPFFRFFGAWTATYAEYARLLARLGSDVAFLACVREGFSFRFRVRARDLGAAIRGPGTAAERAARLVESYIAAVEEEARALPEQYLWMHRRWKRRPPGAADLYRRLGKPLDRGLLAEEERLSPARHVRVPEVVRRRALLQGDGQVTPSTLASLADLPRKRTAGPSPAPPNAQSAPG